MATDNIQVLRHQIRENLAGVFVLLAGQPGLSKEERLSRIEQSLTLVHTAANLLAEVHAATVERDDAARDAEKAAAQAAFKAEKDAMIAQFNAMMN